MIIHIYKEQLQLNFLYLHSFSDNGLAACDAYATACRNSCSFREKKTVVLYNSTKKIAKKKTRKHLILFLAFSFN